MDDIEERLRSHAQAFDGLLSLIPAKYYYGEDNSDQWQRKKQTKTQAREAKRAKLDPDSAKSAKDVMEENARKRKRDEDGDNSQSSDGELGSERPREGLKRGDAVAKKPKQSEHVNDKLDDTLGKQTEEAEARRKQKEAKKAEKAAARKEKQKAKEAVKKEKRKPASKDLAATEPTTQKKESSLRSSKTDKQAQASKTEDDDNVDGNEAGIVAEGLSLELNPETTENISSASSDSNPHEFDASNTNSGSSSVSSIVPPAAPSDTTKKQSGEPKPLKHTPEELKQRLQKRLEELRAARHADGLNGKPARNRQELIEARRQKAEQRKAHKKLLRQKAKEEEQRQKDEAMARRFSPGGPGSLLASPRSPVDSIGSGNNYAFGRVVFADGQHTDPTLSSIRDKPKRQGPQDPATALKSAEAKKARLAAMDPSKRDDIEEKDMWLNAKKRAHGERVRDDTSLLKKALKRKESAKKKSEREWKERAEAIARGKEMRQAKREENLRKRREEKLNRGKKKSSSTGGKRKARPGFEGSFKAKVGGKKK